MRTLNEATVKTSARPVVFFDGNCILCNGFADFILRVDRHRVIRLATLQGTSAASLIPEQGETPSGEDTPVYSSVLLWDGEAVYRKSTAVWRIIAHLGGYWKLVALAIRITPRFLRDAVYDVIARNRFKWFGRRPNCRMPDPNERERFLP